MNLGPRDVLRVIQHAYPDQRGLAWVISRLRPWICPFEEVLRRIPAESSVLDVGCGIGIMTILAAELGGAQRCKGVDVSTKAIATSRNARIAKGTVEFEVATEDQWGVDKFDTVLCVDVLHHVPRASREKFVANLCAAARPGGVVLFKDISPRPRWKYMANCLHDLIMAHQRVSCAPPETVRGWLEAAGMTIREQTPMHRLWYSHYLIVAEKPNSQNKGVDRAA